MWDSVLQPNANVIIKIIYSNHLENIGVGGRIIKTIPLEIGPESVAGNFTNSGIISFSKRLLCV